MFQPEFDEERVVKQTPQAGVEDVTDPRIDLLVSSGEPERYLMPDLFDEQLDKVQAFLEKEGLEVGTVVYRFYPGIKKGHVAKQFPGPGSLVTKDDKINLEVSR